VGSKGLRGCNELARVVVILKVFPSSTEIDLNDLKERISSNLPKNYLIKDYGEEPIAFGLKALRLIVEMPEEVEGGTEALENAIRSTEGVEEVEVEAVHRLT
jgi:elongation factor 1-beta